MHDDFGDEGPTSDLVDHAASYGRWDLVIGLAARGAPISTTGRTPLQWAEFLHRDGVVDFLRTIDQQRDGLA